MAVPFWQLSPNSYVDSIWVVCLSIGVSRPNNYDALNFRLSVIYCRPFWCRGSTVHIDHVYMSGSVDSYITRFFYIVAIYHVLLSLCICTLSDLWLKKYDWTFLYLIEREKWKINLILPAVIISYLIGGQWANLYTRYFVDSWICYVVTLFSFCLFMNFILSSFYLSTPICSHSFPHGFHMPVYFFQIKLT